MYNPLRTPAFAVVIASQLFITNLQSQQLTPAETDALLTPSDGSDGAIISERETVDVVEDSSVAEAIDRRPDLNFNNVTIDGEKATLSLEDIPAEAVSSLEVLRAVTPDLDADSRGGSLSLESNPTYNLKEPVIKGSIKFQFRESGDKLNKTYDFTYGNAYGKFGFSLTGSYSNREYYGEYMSNAWAQETVSGAEHLLRRNTMMRYWETISEKYTTNLKMDYKVSDVLSVFARASFEEMDQQETVPSIVYRYDEGTFTSPTGESATSKNARIDRDLLGYDSWDTEYYYQLGAVATWHNSKLDFQMSYQEDNYIEPDWFVIEFEQTGVDLTYADLGESEFPQITTVGVETVNPNHFTFDELLDEVWKSDQQDIIATLNYKREFEYLGMRAYFKSGIKLRAREKNQHSDSSFYTSYDGDFSLADVLSTDQRNLTMHEGYTVSPVADVEKSREFFKNNYDHFGYDIRRSHEKSDPNTYQVGEDISAAYAMINLERGKWRAIIGARFEQTDLDYIANEVIIDQGGKYQVTLGKTGKSCYQNFFPSLHFRYFWGARTTLIASWTGTIKRPYYGSIVPYRRVDYEDKFIEEGNADLKPTTYDNLDLSLDYKLTEYSTLSLELFRNTIEYIVFWETVDVEGGMFDGFDLGRNNNGPSATQQGINLIWNQSLADINELLDGFSFNLKLSFTDSETEYPNRPGDSLPIAGKAPRQYQLSLTYEKNKTYIQILWSRQPDILQSVDDNAWRDSYDRSRDAVDINSSYQLSESIRLFLDIENLFSEPYQSFRGDPSHPSGFSLNQRRFDFGVKMKW